VVRPSSDNCRWCGERLLWALTVKGKRLPLDPLPVDGGNVVLTAPTTAGRLPAAAVLGKGAPRPVGALYVSHFATCSVAAAQRAHARRV
jgi:hypothetical protein